MNEILFSYTNIWSFNNECTKSRYCYKILYHPTYIHDKTLNIIELHYTGFRLIIWRINSQRNVGQRCGFSNSTSVWKHYKIQLPLRLQLIKILLHIQMKDYFSKKYIAYYVILLFTDLYLYIFLDAWWISVGHNYPNVVPVLCGSHMIHVLQYFKK